MRTVWNSLMHWTCQKTFVFKSRFNLLLIVHISANSYFDIYGYNLCQKAFSHRLLLMRIYKYILVKCHLCVSFSKQIWIHHLRLFKVKKSFLCSICQKAFTQSKYWFTLRLHNRKILIHLDCITGKSHFCVTNIRLYLLQKVVWKHTKYCTLVKIYLYIAYDRKYLLKTVICFHT